MPKRPSEEERDWKMTLFVWRGTLAVSDAKDSVTWEGAWEPTLNHELPGDYNYRNSKNRFVLRTRAYREKDALEILESCGTSGDEQFWGLEHLGDIKLTGSYQLDQNDGEGHKSYSDDWHDMMVSCRGQYAVVAACGSTPFGRFVSLGWLSNEYMVLARRYVADDDLRAAWRTPKDVLAGTDWGILEDDQDAWTPEGEWNGRYGVALKLPWTVKPSKRGRGFIVNGIEVDRY